MLRTYLENLFSLKVKDRSFPIDWGGLRPCTLVFVSFFLSSCLVKEKTSATSIKEDVSVPDVKVSSLISGQPPSTIYEGVPYFYEPDFLVSGATVTAVNLPSWMSLDSKTGAITGTAVGYKEINNVKLIAKKNGEFSEIGPFSLTILGDPNFSQQWHLNNRGQRAYASSSGKWGMDLNLSDTFSTQITGVGSTIAVSDTGLEITHPDLISNLHVDNHKNYNSPAPYFGNPRNTSLDGDHGTSVAGIIAATGWNDIGVRGVAPGAVVAGLNYLNSGFETEVIFDQAMGNYSIFNYSYATSFVPYNALFDFDYAEIVQDQFINGRQGLGAIYVKSAGNSYMECDFFYNDFYIIDDGRESHCFPHNANSDPDNNLSAYIVVGAMNAFGEKASYSSTGSSLWISAFGGEYGDDEPAILTTDQQGCNYGYSRKILANATDFQKGENELNEDCNYTHTFNGTSSAAPMISGIVALLLEVNPNLTSRDIKHILAKTARKIEDPTFTTQFPFKHSGIFNLSGHTYEQNWVYNSAGYAFHNHFGFGLVDGDAAVNMAKSYSANSWGPQIQTNQNFENDTYNLTVNRSIADGFSTGRSDTVYVSESLSIEAVQVKVNITHGRPGDIGIELTSPSGTKSILLNIFNSFMIPYDSSDSPVWVADLDDMVLLSNGFYGEDSQGAWTIKVIDALGDNTGTQWDDALSQSGTFDNWSLNIIGH